jgi:hypothetical protein
MPSIALFGLLCAEKSEVDVAEAPLLGWAGEVPSRRLRKSCSGS